MEEVGITAFLRSENKGLICMNNQSSGWQRDVNCSITFANPNRIKTIILSDELAGGPALFLWLCYEEEWKRPLHCTNHGCPIYEPSFKKQLGKLHFRFHCTANCFQKRQLGLVLVEFTQSYYTWNFLRGNFRTTKVLKPTPILYTQMIQIPKDEYDALLSRVESLTKEVELYRSLRINLPVERTTEFITPNDILPEWFCGNL